MMTKHKEDTYIESITEYQDKMNLPGYYTGEKMHPALKAKTKAGGYGMIVAGIILFIIGFIQFINFSLINMGGLFHLALSVLLIIVGIKVLRQNSN